MKILMIKGSAHAKGTSATLAAEFARGAVESGHDVVEFNAARKNVHGCIGCEKCHQTEDSVCAFQDDMNQLNPDLLSADAVVFVTPIYYYDMNSQIRAVIDRFYANDALLHDGRKTILLTTMADTELTSAEGANVSFINMANFLNWEVAGIVNACNAMTLDMLSGEYLQQAYELGKSL